MDRKKVDYKYYGKRIIGRNTTSYKVSFFVDNKNCLFQHKFLNPLTARKGKWISETMYRDLEKSLNNTHLDTSIQTKMKACQLRNKKL